MNAHPQDHSTAGFRPRDFVRYLDRLNELYLRMDGAYQTAAVQYGFVCRGCEENCCRTRFYHHTLLEYLYLRKGYDGLDVQTKARIFDRAQRFCSQLQRADTAGEKNRQMCPLNDEEMCLLYPYRPMICRLHGIPSELQKPGHSPERNPGCDLFAFTHGMKPYARFDRTPFYLEMARLEKALRETTGFSGRMKLTVAEMIVFFGGNQEEEGSVAGHPGLPE